MIVRTLYTINLLGTAAHSPPAEGECWGEVGGIIFFMITNPVVRFLIFWGVNTLSLWVAAYLFDGISFATPQALFIAGLMLAIVDSFLKPVLVVLTLPLSILTLGLFVLVINALMLLLVAWVVPGFIVTGFWSGFLVAIFVSVFSFILNSMIGYNKVRVRRIE